MHRNMFGHRISRTFCLFHLPFGARTLQCTSQFRHNILRISKTPSRYKHDSSNQKFIGPGNYTSKQYALYFAGCTAAILLGTYIKIQRSKKLQRELFEERIESLTDPDVPFPRIVYGGYVFPAFCKSYFQEIKNFSLGDEDVLVVSFPKSGTTWVQEIVYLIKEGTDKEPDSNLEDRFPYLEYLYPGIKEVAKIKGPRLIKSHMPYTMLPDDVRVNKGKVICVVRNPKDVMVSNYHFYRMLTETNYRGTFKEFSEFFTNNKVPYGPWWNHVASFYLHKDDENMLIVSYEEMHENPLEVIDKMAKFLGKDLSEEEKLHIAAKTTFKNMSENPKTNYCWWDEIGLRNKEESHFLRKGKIGDWQNYMDDEMSKKVEEIVDRYLKPFGIQFIYTDKKS